MFLIFGLKKGQYKPSKWEEKKDKMGV